MRTNIPSTEELKAELSSIEMPRIRWLAKVSGVPFTTLWKIRAGQTENPGIETVRKFVKNIRAAAKV